MPTAPSYIAANTNSNTVGVASSVSVTTSYPTGTSTGDVVVAFVFGGDFDSFDAGTVTAITADDAGWVAAAALEPEASYGARVFTKVVSGESSGTFTLTRGTSSGDQAGVVAMLLTYRGVNTSTPVDAIAVTQSTTSFTYDMNCPAITTTQSDCRIVLFAGGHSTQTTNTMTWAGGTTSRVDSWIDHGDTNSLLGAADRTQASAGSSGTTSVDWANYLEYSTAWTLALAPQLDLTVNGSDAGSGSESQTVAANTPSSDTGSGLDAATGVKLSGTSDSGTGADAAVNIRMSVTDSGFGSDSATVTAQVPAADTSTGTDAAFTSSLVQATDSGQGTDVAVKIGVSGAVDSATGSESAFLSAADKLASDTGGSSENATVTVTAAADTGTGTDNGAGNTAQLVDDAASGTDVATGVKVATSDTASGIDTATVAAEVGGLGAAYKAAVLADAPDAYFPMDDAHRGRIVDLVAGKMGVLSGTVADREIPYPGRHGGDFPDDGSHFKVEATDTAGFVWMGGDYTAEWWAVADTLNQDSPFSQRQSAGVNEGLSVFNVTNKFTTDFGSSSGNRSQFNSYVINTGEWNHYVLVLDSSTGDRLLYVNGVLADTIIGDSYAAPVTPPPLWVGMMGSNAGYSYDGGLAHIAFYRRQLTPTEIEDHYHVGVYGPEDVGEAITGTDTAVRIQPGGAQDAGAAADTATVRVPSADAGTGTDTALVSVIIFASDSATGTDTASITVQGEDASNAGSDNAFIFIDGVGVIGERVERISPESRTIKARRDLHVYQVKPENRLRVFGRDNRTMKVAPSKYDPVRVYSVEGEGV